MTCRPGTEAYTKYSSRPAVSTVSKGPPCLVVMGPTASGKSDLAVALARRFGGEIVNFDSVQVYRGFNIGSAKPNPEVRASIPHHLLDICDAHADMTAGEYARLATGALNEISARARTPVLVGGTGFYLRALVDGLSPAPSRDGAIRERLAGCSAPVLHRFLRRFDPASAVRIHPNDRQKLCRAVEMVLSARKPASEIQAAERRALQGYSVIKIGLSPERSRLYQRINLRTRWMFSSGLLEEATNLLSSGIPPDAKPMQSIGYKQAVRVVQGHCTPEEAILDCQTRTRQYAKRQLTWFRREAGVHWLAQFGDDPAAQTQAIDIVDRVLAC